MKRLEGSLFEEETQLTVKKTELVNSDALLRQQLALKMKHRQIELAGTQQTFSNNLNINRET